jgi:hypothetical protein
MRNKITKAGVGSNAYILQTTLTDKILLSAKPVLIAYKDDDFIYVEGIKHPYTTLHGESARTNPFFKFSIVTEEDDPQGYATADTYYRRERIIGYIKESLDDTTLSYDELSQIWNKLTTD